MVSVSEFEAQHGPLGSEDTLRRMRALSFSAREPTRTLLRHGDAPLIIRQLEEKEYAFMICQEVRALWCGVVWCGVVWCGSDMHLSFTSTTHLLSL